MYKVPEEYRLRLRYVSVRSHIAIPVGGAPLYYIPFANIRLEDTVERDGDYEYNLGVVSFASKLYGVERQNIILSRNIDINANPGSLVYINIHTYPHTINSISATFVGYLVPSPFNVTQHE